MKHHRKTHIKKIKNECFTRHLTTPDVCKISCEVNTLVGVSPMILMSEILQGVWIVCVVAGAALSPPLTKATSTDDCHTLQSTRPRWRQTPVPAIDLQQRAAHREDPAPLTALFHCSLSLTWVVSSSGLPWGITHISAPSHFLLSLFHLMAIPVIQDFLHSTAEAFLKLIPTLTTRIVSHWDRLWLYYCVLIE